MFLNTWCVCSFTFESSSVGHAPDQVLVVDWWELDQHSSPSLMSDRAKTRLGSWTWGVTLVKLVGEGCHFLSNRQTCFLQGGGSKHAGLCIFFYRFRGKFFFLFKPGGFMNLSYYLSPLLWLSFSLFFAHLCRTQPSAGETSTDRLCSSKIK